VLGKSRKKLHGLHNELCERRGREVERADCRLQLLFDDSSSLSKCFGVSNRPCSAAIFLDSRMRKQDSDSQVSSPFGEAYSRQNRRWILDILGANLRMRKVSDFTPHSADFTTRIEAAVYSDRATQTFELAQLSDILGR
jgi:hypothetical protein